MASNAEQLREIYRRFWDEGDWGAGEDVLADDVEWVGLEAAGLGVPRTGRRGIGDFFREWLDAWDSYSNAIEIEELTPDLVVVHTHFRGVGKGSGLETVADLGQVWEFKDGKAVRQTMYRTYDEARRAADLLLQRDAS